MNINLEKEIKRIKSLLAVKNDRTSFVKEYINPMRLLQRIKPIRHILFFFNSSLFLLTKMKHITQQTEAFLSPFIFNAVTLSKSGIKS